MTTAHTATPWHLVDNGQFFDVVVPWSCSPESIDEYCPKICSIPYQGNDGIKGAPNAEFIVRACNAHDDLVKALSALVERIDYYASLGEAADKNIETWAYTEASTDMQNARAALAKATGGAQ